MVADEWVSTTLGKLIQNKEVSVQTGPFGTVLSASEYVKHGIPVISVREIRKGFIKVFDETPCVSEETYIKLQVFALQPYDLVFARKGNVERSALVPDDGNKYFLGSDGIRLRFLNNQLAKVILYLLQTNQIQQFIYNNSYGSTLAGLNESIISSIPVSYPSRENEQTNIARILSDNDSLISSLEKQLAKKKAIKQGTMQELLTGKRRLPGFSGEWNQKLFSDVCEICARMVDPAQKEYANLPHIGNESIEKFSGRITHYNIAKDDQLISGKYLFGCNDVLYGKINPHFAKAAFPKFEGLCSADMYPISCKEDILPEYLLYVLLSSEFTNYTVSLSKRSGIPKVNRDELADYVMLVPSLDEQERITGVLCSMDAEIESLIQMLAKYHQVKQGMMQQLLTGKIRLI